MAGEDTQGRSAAEAGMMVGDFDNARRIIWGTPGFKNRKSMILQSGLAFIPHGTHIIEVTRNDEGWMAFLQFIGKDQSYRLVLPDAACKAIIRQIDSLRKRRHKMPKRKRRTTSRRTCKPTISSKET